MLDQLAIHADILVLILGAILYLTDLARLLHTNEVLFVGRAHGSWSIRTPRTGLRFNRKRAVLARPFDPGVVTLRLIWPGRRTPAESYPSDLESMLGQLFVPRHICTLLLPEIFLGIPIGYSVLGNANLTLALLAVIYLQILVLVVWLFVSRGKLQLSWKSCLLLAFESLICIPYAINMHRKIAEEILSTAGNDALGTGERLLGGDQQRELKGYVCDVIATQIERAENIPPAIRALHSRLEQEIGK